MALDIGSRLGHYEVTALIGEGGMGQVYQATVVVWLLVGLLFAGTPAGAQPGCLGHPVAVQVLGSGGPASVEGRASSSYLVWIDGRARVLVDVGGGSLVRYGESGARIADLDVLAVSHLHPDHVSDLPGLLWHASVLRPPSLPLIVGPSGSALFPSMSEFLNVLVDPTQGAFRVLSGVLDAEIRDIDVVPGEVTTVLSDASVVVDAQSVPHGRVPSLAYRVRVGDRRVVFGSDQTGADERFVEFAQGADVLVMHLTLAETADAGLHLHARPSRVGEVAGAANVDRLVLSHLGGVPENHPRASQFALTDLANNVEIVRRAYGGAITVAEDLLCIAVD